MDLESRQAAQGGDRPRAEALLQQAIAELDKLGLRPDSLCGAGDSPSHFMDFMDPAQLAKIMQHGEKVVPPPEGAAAYNDSPFGIFAPYEIMFDEPAGATAQELNACLLDMGVSWVQELPVWLAELPPSINLYSRIGREGGVKTSAEPDDKHYAEALKDRIAKLKHRVKVYEVGTEPDGPAPMGWPGREAQYANHLRVTYEVVKQECPDCLVVFGGLSGVATRVDESIQPARFLDKVLAAGAAGAFDAFEFKQHMQNADEYMVIGARMKVYGKILAKYGLDIKKMPVFIEVATHDGHARFPEQSHLRFLNQMLKAQSENEQAAGLVKIYVYSLAKGIDKIFWNLVMEHHRFGGSENNPFDLYGVVHNKYNQDGKKGKKLAYYAYKKMVELLGGADFSSLRTLKEEDGAHLYRFMAEGRPLWVAWSDNGPATIAVEGLHAAAATVVQSVPSARTGAEVQSYHSAFVTTHPLAGAGGKLRVRADNEPIYIIDR